MSWSIKGWIQEWEEPRSKLLWLTRRMPKHWASAGDLEEGIARRIIMSRRAPDKKVVR